MENFKSNESLNIKNHKNNYFSIMIKSWRNRITSLFTTKKGKYKKEKLEETMKYIDSSTETLEDDSKLVEEYKSAYMKLIWNIDFDNPGTKRNGNDKKLRNFREKVNKILSSESPENISIDDIENIIWLMRLARKPAYAEKDMKAFTFSKFAYYPDIIKWENLFNCVGATMLLSGILKNIWVECYPVSLDGHMISLVKIKNDYYLIDPINFEWTPIYKKENWWKWIRKISKINTRLLKLPWNKKYWIIQLKEKFGNWKWGYIDGSLNETLQNSCYNNDKLLVSMYEKIKQWDTEQKFKWKYILDNDAIISLAEKYWIKEKFESQELWDKINFDYKIF